MHIHMNFGHAHVVSSSQWLAYASPDPNGEHFPAMVAAALKICEEHAIDPDELYLWW